ncbi:MAG: Alkylmercury lyase [Actinomycetota bacterium]|jgi:hypothetical protein|nr:Alkylmercury lyase [Actinomycetota bacterium]
MLVFRSEEHLENWLTEPTRPRGERMTVGQQWELAQKWFEGRDHPDWQKRSAEEAENVLRSVGLTNDFWKLT